MAIVIIAPAHDWHANCVEVGLREAGCPVVRWHGIGTDEPDACSVVLNRNAFVEIGGHIITADDTIWVRRTRNATLSAELDIENTKFAANEYRAFHSTLMYQLELTGARCINRWSATRRMESKSVQVTMARQIGFNVPPTVFSNRKQSVLDTLGNSGLHKCFMPHGWVERTGAHASICVATVVDDFDSFPSGMFSNAPGIYQQLVRKTADVRVIALGNDMHAFSMVDPSDAVDSRTGLLQGRTRVEIVTPPQDVLRSLRNFQQAAELQYAAYDLCVDEDGAWWFLEVNEGGQFLFLEDMAAGSDLFRHFLAFLAGAPWRRSDFPLYTTVEPQIDKEAAFLPITESEPFATLV